MGKIMSMGLIIYLAGEERYAFPRAIFMHHEISTIIEGKTTNVAHEVIELQRMSEIHHDILAAKTKKTKKWWIKHEQHLDQYYDVTTARTLGIVNR
jgi:ATP-dependent protease ClpP protease subunit